jgi:putative intracellular protease/amidase
MGPRVHVLVFDGLADWEAAHALAELRRSGGLDVVAVGFTTDAVTTMGGLRLLPDLALSAVVPSDVRLFLLPGGDVWEGEYPRTALDAMLRTLVEKGIPVAAICGATLALARAGLLDNRRHTSNAPEYLAQYAGNYKGSASYVPELATRDRGVITASGLGSVEFAREIFEELGVLGPADRSLWFEMFKHGKFPSTSTPSASRTGSDPA